jgi:hypothetical protein
MAILNYGNQFKYSGKGYIDTKMTPVAKFEDLERNVGVLSSLYAPGMKVMVLNDEPFGPSEYFLTESYEWKRIFDFNQLTLSLDKDDIGNDGKIETHLQLMYNNEIVGDAIDLSVLLQDIEDTNTFVKTAELVTEKEGEHGIFIKFTYNDGEVFYTDVTSLQPKIYEQGIGVLIGDDNIISIDETWFNTWFESKIADLNARFETLENNLEQLATEVNTLSDEVRTNTTGVTAALNLIDENARKITEVETATLAAKTKSEENEQNIITLSEKLAKIRGVEYIKPGKNVEVTTDDDGYVTISTNASEVDTSEIENRLENVENIISGHTSDIESLRQAIENLAPEGEALAGDGKTIIASGGVLTVQISSDELNILRANNNGLYAQGIEMFLGDEEINNEENNN